VQEQGWIKVYRSILDKSIWLQSTPEQKTILITLLLMANHEEKEWEWNGKKFRVNPGQFITSLDSIVKKCGKGISIKNVRSAIERFEKLGFLANESTKTGRAITVVNWGLYQKVDNGGGKETDKETDKEMAKEWRRGGKEVAANKNDKNDNNDKNDKKKIYNLIIDYLNEKSSSNYRAASKRTQMLIDARAKEKFTFEDFKKVIDIKTLEWKGTEFERYLRPETLFGTKFEGYLNQKGGNKDGYHRRSDEHADDPLFTREKF